MSSSPTLHLLAEGTRPSIVRIPTDCLLGDFVNLDALAQAVDIRRRLIKIDFFGVYPIDIRKQVLDRFHEGFVGWPLC
jgi:hypothetical protein